ncbi:MAG: alpha-amylase family glycosyl hydrolase [Elusimicrobia bacterium]|nr:alpha-amylase family glycosyl hydrolase [Elusimicrobiota bacterium]
MKKISFLLLAAVLAVLPPAQAIAQTVTDVPVAPVSVQPVAAPVSAPAGTQVGGTSLAPVTTLVPVGNAAQTVAPSIQIQPVASVVGQLAHSNNSAQTATALTPALSRTAGEGEQRSVKNNSAVLAAADPAVVAGQPVVTAAQTGVLAAPKGKGFVAAVRRANLLLRQTLTNFKTTAAADPGELEPPADTPDAMSQISLEPEPGRKYTASPEDWRDQIFYSILMDRFARGPHAKTLGDPKKGDSRHGGDLEGLISKLDYLKELGITTLLLSPVVMGVPEAYHGYAPTHLLAVDPYLGTMADYKRLVREAHARGIRVIKDMVINHVGPVFEYKNGSKWEGTSGPRKEIYWTKDLKPVELKKPENFNRRGEIKDWNDPDQRVHGDFPPNLRDLATDNPATEKLVIDIAKWWIKEADLDGLRLDAIRHVDADFLKRFSREVTEYAATLGKKNFLLLGENSTGLNEDLLGDLQLGVNAGYGYPEYRANNYALHGAAPTRVLEESFNKAVSILGEAVQNMLRFIDLHDVYRFLRNGESVDVLKVAFAFLLFSTGIPLVYYGTEQAFRQATGNLNPEGPAAPADPENRQDMFKDGQFKTPSSAGDKFDAKSPTYQWVKRLAEIRKAHPALSRGEQYSRWNDSNGAGIYAFSRIYKGEEVVVVMNTSSDRREATVWVDGGVSPAGTLFADELDASYQRASFKPAEGGSKLSIDVPAHGVRVLTRRIAAP